jgi:hypothetical protein
VITVIVTSSAEMIALSGYLAQSKFSYSIHYDSPPEFGILRTERRVRDDNLVASSGSES